MTSSIPDYEISNICGIGILVSFELPTSYHIVSSSRFVLGATFKHQASFQPTRFPFTKAEGRVEKEGYALTADYKLPATKPARLRSPKRNGSRVSSDNLSLADDARKRSVSEQVDSPF